MNEIIFLNLTVSDVYSDFFSRPIVMKKNNTINESINKLVEYPDKNYIYIEDEHNKLIGALNLERILNFFFYISNRDFNCQLKVDNIIFNTNSFIIDDLMEDNPNYVFMNSLLKDVIKEMLLNNRLQVPIVDFDRRIIGEITFLNIIRIFNNHNKANLFIGA